MNKECDLRKVLIDEKGEPAQFHGLYWSEKKFTSAELITIRKTMNDISDSCSMRKKNTVSLNE